jgi:hypothetical protein
MTTRTRTVVVLPGRTFGPFVPQLFFPMFAAMRRGAEPVAVEWRDLDTLAELAPDRYASWVRPQVEPVLSNLDPASTIVIGKSLGSYAAALIADLGLPAVWVTPVLANTLIVDALRRSPAPFLLVGGTGDPLWVSDLALQCSDHVLELPHADHGLFVSGPLERSADYIGRLAAATETFLDTVVWPEQDDSQAP